MPVNTLVHVPSVLCYIFFLLPISLVHANAPTPSLEASTELICHTQHAIACYPAIFQPTEYFQTIHHDQVLPAGLYVRMNLATGLKEARLNIPEPADSPHADLVVIDDPPSSFSKEEPREEPVEDVPIEALQDQSNPHRDYPYIPSHFDPEESSLFAFSASALRSSSPSSAPEAILLSLETLTDLCHDYHWGLTLTRDAEIVPRLIYTLDPSVAGTSAEIRSHTALLLGTAVQNNPDASDALLESTNGDDPSQNAMQAVIATLKEPVEETGDPTLHRRTMFFLSQLANDPLQLQAFLMKDALDILHKLFIVQTLAITPSDDPTFIGDGRDKLRAKIANFMYDHVLPALDGNEGQRLASQLVHRGGAWSGGDGRKDLVKVLEPWNVAFGTAIDEYTIFFVGKEEGASPVKYTTYQSVSEAAGLLKKVLEIP